jgi:FkbM family methyltransferase
MVAIVAATAFGPMLIPPFDRYIGRALVHYGEYASAEFETWRPYLEDGSVVLDAGANVGAHTLAFAAAVGPAGRVYAFEPQRHLLQMLMGSLELCDANNVVARNAALGQQHGVLRVPLLEYGLPHNFGSVTLREVPLDTPFEPIACFAVDEFQLERLDFVKIDVEGAELEVLHGATETVTRCRPVISAEADREANISGLLEWFGARDYRVWWHRPPLGDLWPGVVSTNLFGLPRERATLPDPVGDVELATP